MYNTERKGMEKNDYWKVLLIKRFIIILR